MGAAIAGTGSFRRLLRNLRQANTGQLKMVAARLKMDGSQQRTTVARPRKKEPDTSTTAGMFAAYLAHLIDKRGTSPDNLAEATGINRATIFRWLRGDQSPDVDDLDRLAIALGFADAWALKPPKSFVDSHEK